MEHLLSYFDEMDNKHGWNDLNPYDHDDGFYFHNRFLKEEPEEELDEKTTSSGRKVGDTWTNEDGNQCYVTENHTGEIFDVTVYEGGSQEVHFGGPCGSLYIDKFGNS